jgi:hypothetical protein
MIVIICLVGLRLFRRLLLFAIPIEKLVTMRPPSHTIGYLQGLTRSEVIMLHNRGLRLLLLLGSSKVAHLLLLLLLGRRDRVWLLLLDIKV